MQQQQQQQKWSKKEIIKKIIFFFLIILNSEFNSPKANTKKITEYKNQKKRKKKVK